MPETPNIYSIGAVARMLGVPTSTIRTWEDRYGVISPGRSAGGHRLYSRDDVERLRYIERKVTAGLSPGDAHRLLEARIEDGKPLFVDSSVGTKVAVMLADGDPYSADLSDYFLRTEGYATSVMMTAREAEAAFDRDPPHVAIIDVLMSGGAGLSLCRKLTTEGKVPVLAISTLASREKALDAGAEAFLQKPIHPAQLISTVRDILGESAYLRRDLT